MASQLALPSLPEMGGDGVYPEVYFRQRLEEEAHRARRMRSIMTLVLIQGDRETLGHTLREGIRRMDVLGCWKDYLAVLLSEVPREEVAPGYTERLAQQAQGILRIAGVVDTEWKEIYLGACLMPEQKSGKIEVDYILTGAEKALAESAQQHQPVLYKGHHRFIDTPRRETPAVMIRYGDLHLNRDNHKAWVGRDAVEFLPREFELLQYLLKHEGKLVSRDHLCKVVWGYNYSGSTRTVDMHIAKLRKKLKSSRSVAIKTYKGEGYRLDLRD